MKKPLGLILFIGFICCGFITQSQNYVSYSTDNYNGVHGVILNPSAVVDFRFRTDINLFSVSSFLDSDYFSLDLSTVLKAVE